MKVQISAEGLYFTLYYCSLERQKSIPPTIDKIAGQCHKLWLATSLGEGQFLI